MYGVGFGFGAIGATTKISSGIAIDVDAQAFFTANSTLTDATTKTAINQFVLDLKSNSLWSLGKYMYLGFLGNSTKCGYNLFNPSLNQLTFSSGWTFDAQGMQGNGTSSYAQTGFIPSVSADQNSKTIGVYSQTDTYGSYADLGSYNVGVGDIYLPKWGATSNLIAMSYSQWQVVFTDNSTSKGLLLVTRRTSTDTEAYNKAISLGNSTLASQGQSSVQDYLGAYNNGGGATFYSPRKISVYFRFIGMSDTQVTDLNTCINTLLTSLSIPTW